MLGLLVAETALLRVLLRSIVMLAEVLLLWRVGCLKWIPVLRSTTRLLLGVAAMVGMHSLRLHVIVSLLLLVEGILRHERVTHETLERPRMQKLLHASYRPKSQSTDDAKLICA